MSGSIFKILRQCENCGNMFEAHKRTTRFCSHRCASRNYKLRKRLELKKEIETNTIQQIKPLVNTLNIELIKQKDYLKVKEVAALFNCSKQTVYKMIKANELKAINPLSKLSRIRRKDLEQLFEKPINQTEKKQSENEYYLMDEIIDKYKVSRNTIYNYGK